MQPDPAALFAPSMSQEERNVVLGLMAFEPQLAGLYSYGFELLSNIERPGVGFVLAHVGRELSRGLIRALNGDDLSTPFDNRSDEEIETQGNKQKIGGAFQLPADHPMVKEWFRCVSVFSRSCHFRSPSPNQSELEDAFSNFTRMLKGRVTPFFPSHKELKALMEAPEPAEGDLEKLKGLLLHPQQRRSFYSDLQHPGWLQPLKEAGLLQTPPGPRKTEDGKIIPVPWFEAAYLKKVAPHDPDGVLEILAGISPSNENPVVWHSVLDIAKSLPPSSASSLIGIIQKGLLASPPWILAGPAMDLVELWATGGQGAAFKLATVLSYTAESDKSSAPGSKEIPLVGLRNRMDENAMRFLDHHHMQQFVEKVLPALEGLNRIKTFEFLLGRLQRMLSPNPSVEIDYSAAALDCHRWCESLEVAKPYEDIRAPFTVALSKLARRIATQDAASASLVWEKLSKKSHPIFERIRYLVLADAGPSLQTHLDSVVADGRLLTPPFRAKEAAHLLRNQFINVSPGSRFLFKHALERGMEPQELDQFGRRVIEARMAGDLALSIDGESIPSPELLNELNREWQQKRLRWFHDKIPQELLELASRLKVTPMVPSEEVQALDEVGHYSSGARWVGYSSPRSKEDLTQMEPEDLVTFLLSWTPPAGERHSPFDNAPSFLGLEQELAELSKGYPTLAIHAGSNGIRKGIRIGYLAAIFSGLKKGVDEGSAVDIDMVLGLAEEGIRLGSGASFSIESPGTNIDCIRDLRVLHRAVLDLLRQLMRKDLLDARHLDSAWRVVGQSIKEDLTWIDTWNPESKIRFKDWLHRAINTLGGESVDTLLDVARWHHRMLTNSSEAEADSNSSREVVWERLQPLLQVVLDRKGSDTQGVAVILGQELPFLWFLAPSWVESHFDDFLNAGMECPDRDSLWGAFLTQGRIYGDLFQVLRPWYVRAASISVRKEPFADREEWSLTRSLGEHVLGMALLGQCGVGDPDLLLESAFESMSIEERTHCYWWASQGWPHDGPERETTFAQAACAIWEWRLRILEAAPASHESMKEAGGLIWMLRTPEIPPGEAVRMGMRTLALPQGEEHTSGLFWDRLAAIAEVEPDEAFSIGELLVNRELEKGYSFLPFAEVSPVLDAGLRRGSPEVAHRATLLVNRLGEHGMLEFGQLLEP